MEFIYTLSAICTFIIFIFCIINYRREMRIKRSQIYWAVAVCKNSDDFYYYLRWVKIKKDSKPKIRRLLSERREGPFTEEDCDYFIKNMRA